MISNELAEKILDYAMTRGGDYAEIFEEEREYTKIGIAGKETPTILAGQEAGLGVRILKGTKSCYLTFSHPEEGVLFRKMKGALSDWNDRAHIRTFSGKDSFPKRQQVFRRMSAGGLPTRRLSGSYGESFTPGKRRPLVSCGCRHPVSRTDSRSVSEIQKNAMFWMSGVTQDSLSRRLLRIAVRRYRVIQDLAFWAGWNFLTLWMPRRRQETRQNQQPPCSMQDLVRQGGCR